MACRQVNNKRELIRIVRISEGKVEVDITGQKAGRGAYLCQAPECWGVGLNGRQLERTLRSNLTQDNREQLIRYGKDFL